MVGEKVVLRYRMSAGDAHYAGQLVEGAHIVTAWGDVGTELAIRLFGDESLFVGYSEVRYTKEDMEQMENISIYLSEKAKEYEKQTPIPPHTDPEGKDLKCLNLYAWYAKVDGKLYGVIKTVWRYWEPQYSEHLQRDYYLGYYDDSYILYDMTESTVTDISRDDLLNIVGIRNVYRFEYGKYGEGIEIPMC